MMFVAEIPQQTQSGGTLADIVEKPVETRKIFKIKNLKNIFNGGKLAEQPKAKNDFLHQKSIK